MIPIRRTAVATLALGAVLGLSACNNETVVDGAPTASGSSQESTAAEQPTPDDTTGSDTGAGDSTESNSAESDTTDSTTTDSESDGTSGENEAAPQGPATKGDLKDKNAIPVQRTGLPDGPVTDIDVKLLGGYPTSDDYGEFYAVLDVTSTERGLVELQYVMLDKAGNPLKTVKDSIAVGGTDHEMKVTRAAGELPDLGKVEKVQLKVVSNRSNSYATVTQIKQNSLKIGTNSSTKTPTVSGKYRTVGKSSVTSMNVICVDDQGVVRTDNSPLDEIKAPSWTPFTVDMLSVDRGYQPTSCFVGS